MAQVKVIGYDDNGQALNTHSYQLSNSLEQLNDMEREMENLRPTILGDVTHDLLQEAQKIGSRFISEYYSEILF